MKPAPDSLALQLYRWPQAFAYTQAIYLLQLLQERRHARGEARPAAALGAGVDPQAEAVRLRGALGLAFSGSAIASLQPPAGDGGAPAELTVNFFTLGGPKGALPEPYIDMLLSRLMGGDAAGADFLDIFHHRLLSFVFRCDDEFGAGAPYRDPAASLYARALGAFCGCLPGAGHARLNALLRAHAGLLTQERRSMAGLLALVRGFLGVPVAAQEFVGRWVLLPASLQTVLGAHGGNDRLGAGAVLGGRAWDQGGAIRLLVGPMSYALYQALLPGGDAHALLAAACAFYLGGHIVCWLRLELAQAPQEQHTVRQKSGSADGQLLGDVDCRLGYSCWLHTRGAQPDLAERRIPLCLHAPRADSADPCAVNHQELQ